MAKKIINGAPVKRQQGFTLIEVLVSVAIVAGLSATVAPTVFQHVKESRVTKAQSDAQAIAGAITRFRADMDQWPAYADGGALAQKVHGVLFSEAGEWPKLDTTQIVQCAFTGAPDVAGVTRGGWTLLSVAACDTANGGIFISWLPYSGAIPAGGLLQATGTNCDATERVGVRASIPAGSEFHAPGSLDSQLVTNTPALARMGVGDTQATALASLGTINHGTSGGVDHFSMVQDNCAVTKTTNTVAVRAYGVKDPAKPAEAGWNGPYMPTIPNDPWGNKYLVNIHFAFAGSDHAFNAADHANNTTMVLSAGPNGIIETPVGRHGNLAAGMEPPVGGDDIVTRFNLSSASTM